MSFVIQNLLFLLVCHLVRSQSSDSLQNASKICLSTECANAANNLLSSMNQNTDPCDNFYEYACGNWGQEQQDPANFLPVNTAKARTDKNSQEILEFLQKKNDGTEPETVQKVRKLFSLCLDTETLDRKGIEPMKNLLKSVKLSEDPPLLTTNENFDFITTVVEMQNKLGVDMFFKITVTPDPYDQTRNMIGIDKPTSMSLTRIPSLFQDMGVENKNIVSVRKEYIIATFASLCQNSTNKICQGTLSFAEMVRGAFKLNSMQEYLQNRLQMILKPYPKTDERGIPNEIFTLQELQNLTEKIINITAIISRKEPPNINLNWTRILELTFANAKNVTLNLNNSKEIKVVFQKHFFIDIVAFIYSYSLWDHEIGIWWTVVDTFAPYMESGLRESKVRYVTELTGNQTRAMWCTSAVSQVLGMAVSYYYKTNVNYGIAKVKVQEMVQNIKNSLKRIISNAEWMDALTKTRALNKTDSIKALVAYPESIVSQDFLEDYHNDVNITDDFLESVLRLIQKAYLRELNTLHSINDLDKDRQVITPIHVNAFFDPERNTMIIPAGILGFPIYGHGIEALNYGFMGTIVGHEITHSFDTQGRHYNYIGNIADWWEPETEDEFKKRTVCFIEQYGNYTTYFQEQEIQTNSLTTLGENIADNGGFKEALFAYREFVSVNGTEPLLPLFENFTHEQLFTLGFANMWCEKRTIFSAQISEFSEHSPNAIRVNGVARNSEDFSRIWNCPKGSNMNPNADKCQLW